MWGELKKRQTASWAVFVTPGLDEAYRDYKERRGKKVSDSRSAFVQEAVRRKLDRDERLLEESGLLVDWMGLSDRLAERKLMEKRRERKVIRWCIVLDAALDERLRRFLKEYGARHGALCRFVEDAVREAMREGLPLAARITTDAPRGIPPAYMVGRRSSLEQNAASH